MKPLSQVETEDLRQQLSTILCKAVTKNPDMIGSIAAIVHHAMRSHGANQKEARETWVSILAWALRENADSLESAHLSLNRAETALEGAICGYVDDIIKKAGS